MKFRSLLASCMALALLGMAKAPPPCSIRFYTTANPRDTSSFAATVQFGNPPRSICINKIPAISDSDVVSVFPFEAADATYGCALRLDSRGRLRLETVSTEDRGKPLICVVNGRVITAMLIDRPVSDGVLYISSGLTREEIAALTKRFMVMGQRKDAKGRKSPPPAPPVVPGGKYSRGD